MMRRYSQDVRLVRNYSTRRQASLGTGGAFEILNDKNSLMRALGEAREKEYVVGKAEDDFYYQIARSLTSTRNDIGQIPQPNGNGDCFVHTELCRVHPEFRVPNIQTFVGRGLFTNHQSDNVQFCFGTQLAVRFAFADKPISIADTGVHNLLAIDKAKAHDLGIYDGLRTGYLNTWSMGCDIAAAVCSICGNEIQREQDVKCEHVTAHRGAEMISDAQQFPYWKGQKIRACDILISPSFVELSSVTVPADYRAETQEILGEIKDIQSRQAAAIDLSPYSAPARASEVERLADVQPNGDGTYTAIFSTTESSTFADYQTALDFLDTKRRSGSQYDRPSNSEFDQEPGYRQGLDDPDAAQEEITSQTDVLAENPKTLFGSAQQYRTVSGLSQLLNR